MNCCHSEYLLILKCVFGSVNYLWCRVMGSVQHKKEKEAFKPQAVKVTETTVLTSGNHYSINVHLLKYTSVYLKHGSFHLTYCVEIFTVSKFVMYYNI